MKYEKCVYQVVKIKSNWVVAYFNTRTHEWNVYASKSGFAFGKTAEQAVRACYYDGHEPEFIYHTKREAMAAAKQQIMER